MIVYCHAVFPSPAPLDRRDPVPADFARQAALMPCSESDVSLFAQGENKASKCRVSRTLPRALAISLCTEEYTTTRRVGFPRFHGHIC